MTNANISINDTFNGNQLLQFCDQKTLLTTKSLLTDDSYTSEAWGTISWLDHCITTDDGFNIISKMEIMYSSSTGR